MREKELGARYRETRDPRRGDASSAGGRRRERFNWSGLLPANRACYSCVAIAEPDQVTPPTQGQTDALTSPAWGVHGQGL